jgi:hypothetical protein
MLLSEMMVNDVGVSTLTLFLIRSRLREMHWPTTTTSELSFLRPSVVTSRAGGGGSLLPSPSSALRRAQASAVAAAAPATAVGTGAVAS